MDRPYKSFIQYSATFTAATFLIGPFFHSPAYLSTIACIGSIIFLSSFFSEIVPRAVGFGFIAICAVSLMRIAELYLGWPSDGILITLGIVVVFGYFAVTPFKKESIE
jgi:hypothetical protein